MQEQAFNIRFFKHCFHLQLWPRFPERYESVNSARILRWIDMQSEQPLLIHYFIYNQKEESQWRTQQKLSVNKV